MLKDTIQELEKLIASLKNLRDDVTTTANWLESQYGKEKLDVYEQQLKEVIKVAFEDIVKVKMLKGEHE